MTRPRIVDPGATLALSWSRWSENVAHTETQRSLLGGAMLITGGVLWNVYWTEDHESGGETAGGILMGVGGILVVAGAPWLGVRLGRNKSKQRRIEAIDRQLAIAPIFSPGAADSRYGLQLRGTF